MIEKLDTLIKWCNLQFGNEYVNWLQHGRYQHSLLVDTIFKSWRNRYIIIIEVLSHNSYNKLVPFTYVFAFKLEEDYIFFKMRWL